MPGSFDYPGGFQKGEEEVITFGGSDIFFFIISDIILTFHMFITNKMHLLYYRVHAKQIKRIK